MAKEKIQKKAPGSVVARSEDGTIQITFNIPFSEIEKSRSEVVNKYADEIEIPGFRKGKAPQNLVKEKIPENHSGKLPRSTMVLKMADTTTFCLRSASSTFFASSLMYS